MTLEETLRQMAALFRENPDAAVRSQRFIKLLHAYVASDIASRLTSEAIREGVRIKQEAKLFGSHKPKDVDVAVIHPDNGPLMIIGFRSQMSSVAKNALTYYQDIIGECISLQDRFPLATIGYVYMMPRAVIRENHERERVDHLRYGRMYAAISGRSGHDYKAIKGVYDQFAYMIVDFSVDPPHVADDFVAEMGFRVSLDFGSFVDRMVQCHIDRNLFNDYFRVPNSN